MNQPTTEELRTAARVCRYLYTIRADRERELPWYVRAFCDYRFGEAESVASALEMMADDRTP